MERALTLQGWNNTTMGKPTSFMMVSKFMDVSVGVKRKRRFLFNPLSPVQLVYLHALYVSPSVFTTMKASKTGSWVTWLQDEKIGATKCDMVRNMGYNAISLSFQGVNFKWQQGVNSVLQSI